MDSAICTHGHSVNGEIPPRQVLAEAAGEGDPVGAAVVGIVPIGAVGGDLAGETAAAYRHRPVLQARRDGEMGKEGHGLLGQCRGGDVPVVGHFPQ